MDDAAKERLKTLLGDKDSNGSAAGAAEASPRAVAVATAASTRRGPPAPRTRAGDVPATAATALGAAMPAAPTVRSVGRGPAAAVAAGSSASAGGGLGAGTRTGPTVRGPVLPSGPVAIAASRLANTSRTPVQRRRAVTAEAAAAAAETDAVKRSGGDAEGSGRGKRRRVETSNGGEGDEERQAAQQRAERSVNKYRKQLSRAQIKLTEYNKTMDECANLLNRTGIAPEDLSASKLRAAADAGTLEKVSGIADRGEALGFVVRVFASWQEAYWRRAPQKALVEETHRLLGEAKNEARRLAPVAGAVAAPSGLASPAAASPAPAPKTPASDDKNCAIQ